MSDEFESEEDAVSAALDLKNLYPNLNYIVIPIEKAAPLEVYTDGSARPNPGKGGWAFICSDGRKGVGCVKDTTNNRMEMLAAIEALRAIPEKNLTLHSDSALLINTMNKGYKKKANLDLWKHLDELSAGRNIKWVWVKGHNGHPMNEAVDKLAGSVHQ